MNGEIETRLFRYFVTLAEEQHFARAATRLDISPPTLTHQIQKLEDQLGARLFVRKGNTHVELTEAGRRFLDNARQILRQVEESKAVVLQAARGEIGSIEVGFIPAAICAGVVQDLLIGFQQANPAIEINMHKLRPKEQIAAIVSKDLDVSFTRGPDKYPSGLDGFEVFRQPMMLALPAKHPLASREKIEPADLKNENFVTTGPEPDVGFWGHTEVVAGQGKFTPRVVKRDDDMITLLTYVSMGYGIGVISQSMSRISIPNVVYRPVAITPEPTVAIAYVYRRNDSSPSAKLLTAYVQHHALNVGCKGGQR